MITGEKGKAYGLIKPTGLLAKKPALSKPAVFAQDDDDEDVSAQASAVGRKKLKQAEAEAEKLKQQDPSIYDYDGVYEQMQTTKQKSAPTKEPVKQKSKYIGALMEKAKIREREWGIAYDAKLQRERKNEDETYAGKEKFVTSAYKKKLQEDQVWREEEARKAALEEDVTKKSNLNSFYKNLLDGNEAYGGIKEKPEEKKKDKETDRKDRESDKKEKDRDSERDSKDRDTNGESRKRGRDEDDNKKDNGKEERREGADKDIKKEGKDDIKKEAKEEGKESEKENENEKEKEGEGEGERETKKEKKEEKKEEKEQTVVKEAPKKLGEDAVSAARLRYLQRKGMA